MHNQIIRKGRFPLVNALAGAALTLALVAASSGAVLADDLSSLRSQSAALQQKQQQLQQTISQQNSQAATEKQKADTLAASIQVIRQQIDVLDAQISTLNTSINSKTRDIDTTQKQVDADSDLLKQRLRAMYETGEVSYVDVLLSSENMNDFLSRFEMEQYISKHDNDLIDKLKQEKSKLENEKADLQSQKTNLASSEGALSANKATLDTQLEQQNQVVARMNSAVNSTKQQAAAVSAAKKKTDAQIESEIQQEAEAARQAAASGQTNAPVNGNVSEKAAFVVSYVRAQVGKGYIEGTDGPNTFDCSGLVEKAYAQIGIALPHFADSQKGYGRVVDTGHGLPGNVGNLKPGDLVFFGSGGYASHVGVYVGGNQFVAADSPQYGVRLDTFSTSYRPSYFEAVRILD